MIIDFHTHIFPPEIKNNRQRYLAKDPCFAELYSGKNARVATADELIASMDASGIDASVIANIGWENRELCALTNDYIMESVNRYPGRLAGFGSVQPLADWAPDEIARCARGGIKGIGELRPDSSWVKEKNQEGMARFAASVKEHNLILLSHATEPVGHVYPGKGSATPDILYRFIGRFPGLRTVLAHWGGGLPFYALMPEVKKTLADVWFDSAASPFLYQKEIYRQMAQLVGEDKILFGSDYPLLSQQRILDEVNESGLPEPAKSLFLGENAAKLLEI